MNMAASGEDSPLGGLGSHGQGNLSSTGIVLSVCLNLVMALPLLTFDPPIASKMPDILVVTLTPEAVPKPPAETSPLPAPAPARPRLPHKSGMAKPQPMPKIDDKVMVTADKDEGVEDTPPSSTLDAAPVVASRIEDELSNYVLVLWQQINRQRPNRVRYTGSTVIGFTVSPDGTLINRKILRSSGNAHLDDIALEAVSGAAPFPPPPAGATPSQLEFSIPFDFVK